MSTSLRDKIISKSIEKSLEQISENKTILNIIIREEIEKLKLIRLELKQLKEKLIEEFNSKKKNKFKIIDLIYDDIKKKLYQDYLKEIKYDKLKEEIEYSYEFSANNIYKHIASKSRLHVRKRGR
tara:strand:- start:77 stop:451 length:375 start_codon:yes stop_codon:yes gene_type:complete